MTKRILCPLFYESQVAVYQAITNKKTDIIFDKYDFEKLDIYRGKIDSFAFFDRFHKANIHQKYCPSSLNNKYLFDESEKSRINAIASLQMLGVAKNIQSKLSFNLSKINDNPNKDIEIFSLVLYSILIDFKFKNICQQESDKAYKKISPFIDNLKKNIYNQDGFAKVILTLIEDLDEKENKDQEANDDLNSKNNLDDIEQDKKNTSISPSNQELLKSKPQEESQINESILSSSNFCKAHSGSQELLSTHDAEHIDYKIFTKKYDEFTTPKKLCSKEELANLRVDLDKKFKDIENSVTKKSNDFVKVLQSYNMRNYMLNCDEGLIDSSKLAQLVANGSSEQIFKQEHQQKLYDTSITILLDNSGSMRGKPILFASYCCEELVKVLEKFSISVEILGFTTSAWKGGKSRKEWLEKNSPKKPGRLNDIRHIIYKSSNDNWRKAKTNLGLVLKEGVLKENIDGHIRWSAC